MHTKDIEYAISMVAHPKALTIRTKALAQLNELQNRIIELEQKLAISDLACEEQIKINSTLLQEKESAQQSPQADVSTNMTYEDFYKQVAGVVRTHYSEVGIANGVIAVLEKFRLRS